MQPHYATPPISGPGPPLAPSYRFLLLPKSNSACSSSNSSSTSNSSSLYRTPARGPPFNSDIVVSPSSSSSTSPIDHYLQPELDEPSSHPDPDPDPDLDPPAPKKEPRKRRRLRTEEPRDMERRRHGCPEYGKVFARPSAVTSHMRSHSKEKPFVCPLETCQRGFTVLGNMKRHVRNKHPGTTIPDQTTDEAEV